MEKAKQICHEMLTQRGYTDIKIDTDNELYCLCTDDKNRLVYVYACSYLKLNINVLKEYINNCFENNIQHAIIIYNNIITSSAKKLLDTINIEIELFTVKELQYNITKHILVPKHILLSREISNSLKEKDKYPILLSTDPVSRFYNFQRGSVIKIDRKTCIIYRVVR